MRTKAGLERAFEPLTEWRAQPGYQLERRLDALLAPFLAAFLETRFGEGARVELVTSELAIPKSALPGKAFRESGGPERDNVSADFLLLRHAPSPAWILLELKTDMGSRDEREDANYAAVAGQKITDVLRSLRKAKKGTSFEKAYLRQAWRVGAHRYPEAPIEICYLQPVRAGKKALARDGKVFHAFTLREFADSDVGKGDELWELLKPLLRGVVRSDKARRTRRAS